MVSNTHSDAMRRLGGAFDEAVAQGYLREKPKTPDDEVIRARRRVIGGYLFLLGYLVKQPAEKNSADQDDGMIRQAIGAFQNDAGLVEDGWAGRETWDAVQELASFEYPFNVARWFVAGEPRPVLRRAVYLRLFALGLTKLPPRPDTGLQSRNKESESDFQNGLQLFVRAARSLRLSDRNMAPALVPETLDILFHQDRLSERINIRLNGPNELPLDKGERDEAYDFVRNVAQIELWLYGFNVRIGNFRRGGPFDRPGRFSLSFSAALHEFAVDHGLAEDDFNFDIQGTWSNRSAMDALPWFFKRLAALDQATPEAEETVEAGEPDHVVDRILQDKNTKLGVRDSIKSLGARLWDGVKRVGKWIRSIFAAFFNTVKKVAKSVFTNISRFVHESALRIYSHVVAAVRAVTDGIDFLKERILLGSDPRHMVVMHDGDLDFDVFVNMAADPATVVNLSERIVLRSEILSVGSKIVSSLTSFFLGIVRAGITTGWFALMLALVRLYKTVKQLREFSKQSIELTAQLDNLRAQA